MQSPLHNVSRWIQERARLGPERPAIVDDDRALNFAALEDRVARAAAWLAAEGIGRGDRVALVLGNRSAYLELVFAAARLGAIAMPINTRLAPPEVAQLLEDARPGLLIHEAALAPLIEASLDQTRGGSPRAHAVGGSADAYEAALAALAPQSDIAAVSPEDPMILMYTSGTTGTPKGALLPHRKTFYNSLNAQIFFGCTQEDRVLTVVPLFHSFGLLILALPALYCGATVVLQTHFEPTALWDAVARHRVTYFGGVPTMFGPLQEALDAGRPDVSSLRFLFTAGAAIPVERIHAFEERGLRLKQGFGQTETSILCCLDAADAIRKAGSVGRPVFHAEVRIIREASLPLPPEEWQDCAFGESGEIVVRGPINMLGYWERPEANAETLRGEWLRTGDLGSFDEEGFVTLTGRARDMFISGGENVYPRQVEAIYETHPDILELAVIGVPHERWGETGHAYIVARPGFELEPEALRAWGRERLASFKVPTTFEAVDELPKTITGKVQKFRLGSENG
ncbi:MAG: AMP-binding protein [Deltaproteobacteria bacterium]|nr:AMP-binding protein [Deltaproteobacteria bacterium]MBW2394720.1 AMP-binding protein [Deltaproteobacteria bacterium]